MSGIVSGIEYDNETSPWSRMWAKVPHVRFGDPCHDCGVRLAPASRRWCAETLPPGVRKHAGNGLCGSCANRRDAETPGWRKELHDGH